ncbi:MAG: hypothetical protein JNL01_04695 [Bdellovibrionales bacterium]|nr:hypothetical protein [Bdellovibrionales bacterium]
MNHRSRHEAYQQFLEFIRRDSQKDRNAVNRRMLSVFIWCFLIPVLAMTGLNFLVKMGWVPLKARAYSDVVFLIFPVAYSVYFLNAEVVRGLPRLFRQGGLANSLRQADEEDAWREKVVDSMKRTVGGAPETWAWVYQSFRMDLEAMENRTRYLTALAGAVLFLIMQGIDLISDEGRRVVWEKDPVMGWVETNSFDTAQYIGLVLFLLLLYLSGMQTVYSLRRYLNCAEIVQSDETKGV